MATPTFTPTAKLANLRDYKVSPAALALPAAAAASVTTAAIDRGGNGDLVHPERIDLEIKLPAQSATILPNGETLKINIEHSADDSTYATLQSDVLVQTGAGGAGAAAASVRYRCPDNTRRYVRAKATLSASATDASANKLLVTPVFMT
jgi:hypothetical protein